MPFANLKVAPLTPWVIAAVVLLSLLFGWLRARREARRVVRGLGKPEGHLDVAAAGMLVTLRGILRGATREQSEVAWTQSTLDRGLVGSNPLSIVGRVDGLSLDTSDGRVELVGPIEVLVGSVEGRRKPWPFGGATLARRRIRGGDEVRVFGRLEWVPDGEAQYREAAGKWKLVADDTIGAPRLLAVSERIWFPAWAWGRRLMAGLFVAVCTAYIVGAALQPILFPDRPEVCFPGLC
jgi:hypothetical protein